MAEKKKKPSPKQLAELQDLYTALESDVGISKVDEKLLQKFEQGELSKTEADKLRGELNQAMTSRTPAAPEVKQLGPAETGPAVSERALTTTPGQAVMPTTLTPEVVSARARAALPPAQPGVIDATVIPESKVLLNAERPGPLAVRTTESAVGEASIKNAVQVAEKNPMLKRLMFPLLAVAGVGAATYSTVSTQDAKEKPSTPPGPGPTPPAPAPAPAPAPGPAPLGPREKEATLPLVKAKVVSPDSFQSSLNQYMKRYQEDRQLTEKQKTDFALRQEAIQRALNDAKTVYEETTSKARSEADHREAIARWGSIAESFGQALVKLIAAREGARTGTLLGSKLQFEKYNWQSDIDRSLERLKADTADAKTILGIAREDVEARAKQLGEERKTAAAEREDIAQQQFKSSTGLLTEQMRAQQRAEEDYASAYNRFLLERAQEEKAAAREAAREQKATTKQETKTTEEIADATKKALEAFSTGFSTSQDRRASYRGDMEKELFTLGATEAEVKRLNELMDHTYGQRDETDKTEARALINSISQRKLGGASAAPAAPAQTSGQEARFEVKFEGVAGTRMMTEAEFANARQVHGDKVQRVK